MKVREAGSWRGNRTRSMPMPSWLPQLDAPDHRMAYIPRILALCLVVSCGIDHLGMETSSVS